MNLWRTSLSSAGGRGGAVTDAPRPAPPPRRPPVDERLAEIAERPLEERPAAFEELHRDLETRLRASET